MTNLIFALVFVALPLAPPAYVDALDVAARLISIEAYDDALEILNDPALDAEDVDATTGPDAAPSRTLRRETLRGLAHLRKGDGALARAALLRAVRTAEAGRYGSADRALYVTLADASFLAGDCPLGLQALSAAAHIRRISSGHRLAQQSDCYAALGRSGLAYRTLHDGAGFLLTSDALAHRELSFLLERGLHRAAFDVAAARLPYQSLDVALMAIDGFVQVGALDAAYDLALLVGAAHPRALLPRVMQARILAERGDNASAGKRYEALADVDPQYAADAAEIARRQQRYARAKTFNRRVPDDAARLRQRFALDVESGDLVRAAHGLEVLERRGLLTGDEKLRHAGAYVSMMTGDWARAERLVAALADHTLRTEFTLALSRCRAAQQAGQSCQ